MITNRQTFRRQPVTKTVVVGVAHRRKRHRVHGPAVDGRPASSEIQNDNVYNNNKRIIISDGYSADRR